MPKWPHKRAHHGDFTLQNWLNGDANYGIYIGANGTANGWQIFTSGAVDTDLAPMLRILTVPEPSTISIGLLVACLVAACGRQKP